MFGYLLATDIAQLNKKYQRYKVDLFLFYPPQMHVTKQNYPKSLFYSDLRTLTRLEEPRWGYKQFLPTSPQSPLYKVMTLLQKETRVPQDVRKIVEHIRSYACLYASYLSRKKRKRHKWLQHAKLSESPKEWANSSSTTFRISQLMEEGRLLLRALIETEHVVLSMEFMEAEIEAEFSAAVEYCFFLFQKMVGSFFLHMESVSQKLGVTSYEKQMKAYVRYCYLVILRRKYVMLTEKSSREELENFANRQRALKQRMEQPLYVKLETPRFFIFRKQLGSMVAAGVAATWTLIINILIFTQLHFSGFQTVTLRDSDGVIALSTLFILLAFVLAYIMQERIKEIGISRFNQGVLGELPDHEERMWAGAGKEKIYVGLSSETCNFIRYDDARIREIQKKRMTTAGGFGLHQESILHYERTMELPSNLPNQVSVPVIGLRDNIRINMKQFLPKLDEPYYMTPFAKPRGEVSLLQMPKNYQLDLVLVMSEAGAESSTDFQPEIKRLILNKEGLLRVEDVKTSETA